MMSIRDVNGNADYNIPMTYAQCGKLQDGNGGRTAQRRKTDGANCQMELDGYS